MIKAILYTDGGSRGNPGPSGLGFHLRDREGSSIARGGWYLSRATNNEAEYSALVWGLENALAAGVDSLEVFADSELIVKQMQGIYQVKSNDLKPLFLRAKDLLSRFDEGSIHHIYRADNEEADLLANESMDAKRSVGNYLIPWESGPKSLFEDEPMHEVMPYFSEGYQAQNSCAKEPSRSVLIEKNNLYSGHGKLTGRDFEDRSGYYELSIKDHFDASHILVGYDGPCRFLHGHTWDIEVTVRGEQLDSVGIVYDFKSLKDNLKAILENFDHRHINDVPPFDHINPTAENLARVIFYEFVELLPKNISLYEVVVWESPAARLSFRA